MSEHLVFVYGTLMSGFGNHNYFMRNAIYVRDAEVDGKLLPVSSFPAYLPSLIPDETVKGEIYLIDGDTLYDLDGLEGYHPEYVDNSMYVRKTVRPNGFDEDVFIYEWNTKEDLYKYSKIENGDYRQWYRDKVAEYEET